MVLCDDCNSKDSKYIEYLINESFQYEHEHSTSEIEEDEDAMTGHAHYADEEQEDQKSIMMIAMTSNNHQKNKALHTAF